MRVSPGTDRAKLLVEAVSPHTAPMPGWLCGWVKDAMAGAAGAVVSRVNTTGVQSLDEYPFACSAQGGCGATVHSVPVAEQNYQGGVISRFFQNIWSKSRRQIQCQIWGMMSNRMKYSLTVIDSELKRLNRKTLIRLFGAWVRGRDVRDSVVKLGLESIPEIETLYAWHNGVSQDSYVMLDDIQVFPGFYMLSIDDAIAT